MKGKIMSDKNNGWNQPEEKFPENEIEDSFAGFFSEEEEIAVSEKGKKRGRKKAEKGPDILAVSEEADPGFVITEVVALDTGSEIVAIKEEPEEENNPEETFEHEENADEHAKDSFEHAEDEEAKAETETEPEDNAEEPLNEENKEAEEAPKKQKKVLFPRAQKIINKKRKHKYVATIGAVLIALAAVGAVSVCSLLFNLGARILDNTSQKEAFEWKIYPLLMLDPATFDDPAQLDEVFVLKTALWSTLLENRTKYTYDEMGMLIVPASDLDVAAKSLYGNAVTLKHQTFAEGYEFSYLYDEETGTYSVPIMGQTAIYVPKVVDINKNGDIYTLIAGYVAPTTLWNVSEGGDYESVPDKYLYYDLEKIAYKTYVIKSVRSIPADELPDDLEVSDVQSLNQTQYFDYDALQQEQINQQLENMPEENLEGETAEGENPEEPLEEND